MKRILLTVSYDGTNYCGWQIQPNGITIEEELNRALFLLLGEEIKVIGASRTDSGVHAMGNRAVFDTSTRIPAEKISFALNQYLPDDIVIQKSIQVPDDFHPRHQNTRKHYRYQIWNSTFPDPIQRHYAYFFHRSLDIEKMREAAGYFIGEHDFKSFCSIHAQVKTTVRTIYRLDVTKQGSMILVDIEGNGFLYNMVRIITGTLIDVGVLRYPPEHIREILEAADRQKAGPCAPPQGLCLRSIEFPDVFA